MKIILLLLCSFAARSQDLSTLGLEIDSAHSLLQQHGNCLVLYPTDIAVVEKLPGSMIIYGAKNDIIKHIAVMCLTEAVYNHYLSLVKDYAFKSYRKGRTVYLHGGYKIVYDVNRDDFGQWLTVYYYKIDNE